MPMTFTRMHIERGEFGDLLRGRIELSNNREDQLGRESDVFYESFETIRHAIRRYANMTQGTMIIALDKSMELHRKKGVELPLGDPDSFTNYMIKMATKATEDAVDNSKDFLEKISGGVGHSREYNDILKLFSTYFSDGHAYESIVNRMRNVSQILSRTVEGIRADLRK